MDYISKDPYTQNIIAKYPILSGFCNMLHGSGIDYSWTIHEQPDLIRCHNSFHGMNDVGMYDGLIPFVVKIPKNNVLGLSVHCNDESVRYYWNKYDLAEDISNAAMMAMVESLKECDTGKPLECGIREKITYEIFPVIKQD